MFTAGMMPHLLVSLGKTLRYQFKCHPENIKVLLLSQKSEFPKSKSRHLVIHPPTSHLPALQSVPVLKHLPVCTIFILNATNA